MAKLPVISGAQCIKALQRAGYEVSSQKGSHVKLRRGSRTVIVNLAPTLDRGTLGSILKQAGLTTEELKNLLYIEGAQTGTFVRLMPNDANVL